MAKSLVLHLGDHKTGSTSIQYALKHKAVRAAGVKILYPTPPGYGQQHNAAVRALIRDRFADLRAEFFAPITKIVAGSEADVAVLSAESFERADPIAVQEMLETYFADLAPTARLIVYLRPHSERLLSSYAEQVKQGIFFGSLDEFYDYLLSEGQLFYAPRIARWKAVFGDRLSVRVMTRSHLLNGDVVQDFFDFVLGAGTEFTLEPLPETNQKLCVEDLSVLAALQEQLRHIDGDKKTPREPARALGWRVARMLETSRKEPGTPLMLHKALAERLITTYRADAETLDDLYFPDAPLVARLQMARDNACPHAQSLRLEDHFAPANIRLTQSWLDLIEKLYCCHPENWPKHFKAHPFVA
jgi:hypothetical protein